MAKIISVHSFRGGTGKSNTTANIALLLASQGYRVGVIDTDIQSPGIHNIFGLKGEDVTTSLNDYLWKGHDIIATAVDVSMNFEIELSGQLYLIPSSIKPNQITRVLREGYDAERLTKGLRSLVDGLSLDVLMIDTHPGLNEETLLSLIISHILVIVMRPDRQDYEGTGITIEVAQQLDVPRMVLLINKAPKSLQPEALIINAEQAYQCEVVGVIPHSDEMMTLASNGIFAVHYPNHPITRLYAEIASKLIE